MELLVAAAFGLSALLCAATAVLAWERRSTAPAGRWLTAMLLAAALWSLTEVGLLFAPSPDSAWILQFLVYAFVDASVVTLWCLCRSVADPHWRLTRPTAGALCAPLLAVLLFIATNPWHDLFLSDVEWTRGASGAQLTAAPGPLHLLQLVVPYALVVWALAAATQAAVAAPPLLRKQLVHLLMAAALPLGANVVVMLRPEGTRDVTAMLFAASTLLVARALLQQGLLRIVPVARTRVLETLDDAVVVLDRSGRVVDLNPAALRLLVRADAGLAPESIVGGPAPTIVADAVQAHLQGVSRHRATIGPGVHVDARVTRLDAGDTSHGLVVVLREISELVEQQRALEMANGRLRDQLVIIEELRAQLAEDAIRDPLTGLHNRVHLDRTLDVTLQLAAAGSQPVSLLTLELDDVARLTRERGFEVVEEVLRTVSRDLSLTSRDADVVARTDGERFVLVLPGMDAETAARRAQALRDRCAALSLRRSDRALGLTATVGVATFPRDGHSGLQLLAAADRALARARSEALAAVVRGR